MAGKGRVLPIGAIFLSLAALAASFQNCTLLLSLLMMQYRSQRHAIACFGGHWRTNLNFKTPDEPHPTSSVYMEKIHPGYVAGEVPHPGVLADLDPSKFGPPPVQIR